LPQTEQNGMLETNKNLEVSMSTAYRKEPAPFRILKARNIYFPAHFHKQAEITYCKEGRRSLLIDGCQYMLYAGDAAFIFPNQHFTEDLSLKSLAKELGMSTSVLTNLFSQSLNCSFTAYLNDLRLEYAKSLLRSDHYSIHEITQLCGFQSDRSFFRNFKQQNGLTPGEYRRQAP